MATANTLFDDFLSSDVDESAISALVGSLENQLASPTSKEHIPQNSATSVNSNHIGSSQVGSSVPIQALTVASPLTQGQKPGSQQTNSQIINSANPVIKNTTQHQIIGINSVVSAAPIHTNSLSTPLSSGNHAHLAAAGPNVKLTNSQTHAVKVEPQPQTVISSTNLPGQVIITVGSNNTGTVNSTNSVNSIHGGLAVGNTNGVQSTGGTSSSGGSAIYNLASIAAEQQPLAIPNTGQIKLQQQPQTIPGRLTVREQLEKQQKQTVDGNGVSKTQFVIKQEPQMLKQENQIIKQETNIKHQQIPIKHENISQPQVLPQTIVNTTIKSGSPSPASVITINKQQTPQTVTVVKPNSTATSVPHTQIQIINMSSRPSGISTPPKTLAPRMVPTPIRIAPQQIVNAPRPQSGIPGAVTLPPGFQLPAGTVLVRNEHGQIVVLSGQQGAGIQPQPGAGYKLQTVKQQQPVSSHGHPPRSHSQQPMIRQHSVSPQGQPPTRIQTQQPLIRRHPHHPASMREHPSHHPHHQDRMLRHHPGPSNQGHRHHYPSSCMHPHQPMRQQLVSPVSASSSQSPRLSTPHPVVTMTQQQLHSSPQATVVRSVQQAGVAQNIQNKTITATSMAVPQTNIPQTVVSVAGQNPSTIVQQPQAPPQQPQLNQNMMDNVKKCKNFLSTLIKLASNQPATTVKNVKELIQGLIDGNVVPEIFTEKLQIELKSSPQPYLVPFLKKSLPLLRHCLSTDKMTIEGVRPPPPNSRVSMVTLPSTVVQAAATASSVQQPPIPQTVQLANLPSSTTISNHPKMRQMTQAQFQQYQLLQAQGAARGGATAAKASAIQTKSLLTRPSAVPAGAALAPATVSALQKTQASTPHAKSVHSSPAAGTHKEKRKYESLKDDDDINDVATMGGVNLSEESRNILATNSELIGTQHRSCKDENFLYTSPLLARINSIVRKHGLDDVPQEVANLVSHATQERLRNIVERLSVIAEHRLELYKNDSRFEVKSTVKSQLKFLEELDKLEKKRHEEQEREVLLRAAKSRSKHEDPEQLKLKQKAKEMQQAEMELTRQREANLTALAAIGPRKKRKTDGSDSAQAGTSSGGAGGADGNTPRTSLLRPRMKRVNLRDLIFLLEQDRETTKSSMLYKAFLK